MPELVTIELLKGFLEAFNRHDLDSIMGYFAEDCVFYMPRGSTYRGNRYVGKNEVRAGLASDLREFRMYITGTISTGRVMISEFPNGP